MVCRLFGVAVQERHLSERMGGCRQCFGITGATCESGKPLRAGCGRGLAPATREEGRRPAERRNGILAVLAALRELQELTAARFSRRVLGLLFVETCQPPGAVQ